MLTFVSDLDPESGTFCDAGADFGLMESKGLVLIGSLGRGGAGGGVVGIGPLVGDAGAASAFGGCCVGVGASAAGADFGAESAGASEKNTYTYCTFTNY